MALKAIRNAAKPQSWMILKHTRPHFWQAESPPFTSSWTLEPY